MSKLSDIMGRLEGLRNESDGYVAVCPAHSDSHPSLRVALSEEGNVILKCRAGCSTADVVDALGLEFSDLFGVDNDEQAVITTGGRGEVPLADQAQMAAYLRSCSDRFEGSEAEEYAARRFGVNPAMARALGLGFDPGGHTETFHLLGAVHHQVARLVVPFRDAEGIPRGFQARALGEHTVRWSGPTNPPDGGSWSRLAFFPSGSGSDVVVVAEGPGDACTAAAAGGVDSVGIRGAALASGVAEELESALRGRRVVLAGDADEAGQKMNEKLAERLLELGMDVRILTVPSSVGDISGWFEQTDGFSREFQDAVFSAPMAELEDRIVEQEPDARFPQSHVEIAKLVVERFSGDLVYILGIGFHVFSGGVWKPDRLEVVRLELYAYGDEIAEFLEILTPGSDEYRDVKRLLMMLRRSQELDRIVREIGVLTRKEPSDFDNHPDLLAVRNGVLNLRTGVLEPHRAELYLTQLVDVDYVPTATAPRWERFLEEVFPEDSAGMASFVQRLVGYGITGRTTEQAFAVLWGRGANGKSVFTETLGDVFEGISRTTPFDTFEEKQSGGIPNDIAALRGARLVFASEGERGKHMAESVIKRMTGQDKISARFMRQEFFEFRPSFLLILATNHKPSFRSADEGLWRRVKMVPWARYFAPEDRDPYLQQNLVKNEAEGILAWAVRGSVAWYESGLQETSIVKEATASYRDGSDVLASFFPHGPLEPAEGNLERASDVWEAYLSWCDEEMLPPKERWGRNTFYAGLEERGLVKLRKDNRVMLEGARIVEGREV